MSEDFQIGSGSRGNSWCIVYRTAKDGTPLVTDFISGSSVSFLCRDQVFGIEFTVMCNTPEGKSLREKIDKLQTLSDVQTLADTITMLVLKHAKLTTIKNAVENLKQDSFFEGSDERARQIRKSLGL